MRSLVIFSKFMHPSVGVKRFVFPEKDDTLDS